MSNKTENVPHGTAKSGAKQNPEIRLLEEVYKNTKMGSDAILSLLPKVEDGAFRQDLTCQLTGYQGYALDAARLLLDRGQTPEELTVFKRIPAQIGIEMNTAFDKSTSKLSELMINGSTMGIIDMRRALREASDASCAQDVADLGNTVIRFEENNVEKLKTYL